MSFANLRQDYIPFPATKQATPQLAAEIEDFAPIASPALALQEHLARHTVPAPATDIQKWSPRRSLALIIAASAALWLAILMVGAQASKLIA